ncbi:MAG: serine/threonine protein kinase, partial [Polyangiaceae bacterium]|nr:serine/threonine protein kinase [Polyangiaceae bacterium]
MSDLLEATSDGGLQPGELVDGRYALVKPLGRGGMGEVWYAFDGQTGGQVALKFVRGKDGAPPSPALRARQLREARAAQRVQHPRVVALHGIVDDETHGRVIVMDYLEGESLADKIARHGALPLGEAAGLAIDLCEGLGAAHAVGVVHRDLKPSNVLLVPGEGGVRPCLIDFGVAKLLSLADEAVSSTAGGFAGTPMYMAPEQLFGEGDVDHRADVWSLGLLLFDALTGHTPTAGAHLGEVLKKVLEGPLPRARSFMPELPAEIDQVLARMLLRDRAERPTLAEVAGIFAPFAGCEAPTRPLPAPNALAFAETLEARPAARVPAGPLPTTLGPATGPLPTTLDASAGHLPLSRSVRPLDVSGDGGPGSSVEASSGRRWGNLGAMAVVAALVAGVLGAGARYRAAFGEPSSGRAGAHRVRSFAVIGPSADLSPEAGSAQTLARTLALGWASSAELRVVPPEAAARVGQAR